LLGADWHERTEERLGHRNGYRPRTLTTQVGDLELQIRNLRNGSFMPAILEPPGPIRSLSQSVWRWRPAYGDLRGTRS